MSRTYCHACNVDYYTHHAWLHRQSKTHKKRVNELFPMPPSPWRTDPPDNKISLAAKFPHLGYLQKTTKRT